MINNQNTQFSYPPDSQKALRHRRANQIFKGLTKNDCQTCQCCGRRVGKEQVEISCMLEPGKLSFLGPGVPLFFNYIRLAILMLAIMSIVFVLFSLASNLLTNDCPNFKVCAVDIFNFLAIINKGSNKLFMTIQTYLQLTFSMIAIVFFHYIRYKGRVLKQECDEVVTTPSDYALILRRLPLDVTQSDIMDMINTKKAELTVQQLKETDDLKVVKIILSYWLGNYNRIKELNAIKFKEAIKESKYTEFIPQPMPQLTNSSSIAIVVFEKQHSKDYLIHKPRIIQRILQFFCTPCVPISQLKVKGMPIGIQRAPEPDDICWQNSGITLKGAIGRKIFLSFIAIVVLVIGGLTQFGLQVLYQSTSDSTIQTIITVSNSIIILVFNALIMITLVITTEKERNQTLTEYQNVLMVKQAFFQYFNAGIFVVAAKVLADSKKFTVNQGLCSDITIIMITNCFVPNITLFILSYTEIINHFWRWMVSKQWLTATQYELNQLYLGPSFDISSKYALLLKIIWLTGFYAPLVPVVVVTSTLGLTMNYFIEKFLFAKAYSIPNTVSSMVYENALELLEYFLVTYSMGQMIIYFYLFRYQLQAAPIQWIISIFVCLSLSVINLLLPMQAINQKIFPLQQSAKSSIGYSAMLQNFQVTYQMLNPAYKTDRKRNNIKDLASLEDVAIQMTNLFNLVMTDPKEGKIPLLNKNQQGGTNGNDQDQVNQDPLIFIFGTEIKKDDQIEHNNKVEQKNQSQNQIKQESKLSLLTNFRKQSKSNNGNENKVNVLNKLQNIEVKQQQKGEKKSKVIQNNQDKNILNKNSSVRGQNQGNKLKQHQQQIRKPLIQENPINSLLNPPSHLLHQQIKEGNILQNPPLNQPYQQQSNLKIESKPTFKQSIKNNGEKNISSILSQSGKLPASNQISPSPFVYPPGYKPEFPQYEKQKLSRYSPFTKQWSPSQSIKKPNTIQQAQMIKLLKKPGQSFLKKFSLQTKTEKGLKKQNQ